MTQSEAFEVLKKEKRWMTAQEIADILKQGTGSISCSLRKLLGYNEIQFKETKKTDKINKIGGKPYLYKINEDYCKEE